MDTAGTMRLGGSRDSDIIMDKYSAGGVKDDSVVLAPPSCLHLSPLQRRREQLDFLCHVLDNPNVSVKVKTKFEELLHRFRRSENKDEFWRRKVTLFCEKYNEREEQKRRRLRKLAGGRDGLEWFICFWRPRALADE